MHANGASELVHLPITLAPYHAHSFSSRQKIQRYPHACPHCRRLLACVTGGNALQLRTLQQPLAHEAAPPPIMRPVASSKSSCPASVLMHEASSNLIVRRTWHLEFVAEHGCGRRTAIHVPSACYISDVTLWQPEETELGGADKCKGQRTCPASLQPQSMGRCC